MVGFAAVLFWVGFVAWLGVVFWLAGKVADRGYDGLATLLVVGAVPLPWIALACWLAQKGLQ